MKNNSGKIILAAVIILSSAISVVTVRASEGEGEGEVAVLIPIPPPVGFRFIAPEYRQIKRTNPPSGMPFVGLFSSEDKPEKMFGCIKAIEGMLKLRAKNELVHSKKTSTDTSGIGSWLITGLINWFIGDPSEGNKNVNEEIKKKQEELESHASDLRTFEPGYKIKSKLVQELHEWEIVKLWELKTHKTVRRYKDIFEPFTETVENKINPVITALQYWYSEHPQRD